MSAQLLVEGGPVQEIRKRFRLPHQVIVPKCICITIHHSLLSTTSLMLLIQSISVMRDEVQGSQQLQERRSLAGQYNCHIIKKYLTNSRVTMAALVVVWIVYIIECLYTWVNFSFQYGAGTIHPVTLVKMGGNIARLVQEGQVYRLLTATVLHAGIMHIFMNSASLIAFCAEVEATISFKLYLLVLVVGGIQGNMLSDLYHLNLDNSVTVGVGASTSICAVMGFYMAKLYVDSKKSGRVQLAKRQIITMLVYLLIVSLMPSVDFFGHFGSLISGGLIGLIVLPWGEAEFRKLSWIGIAGLSLYTLILFTIFV